MTRVRQISSPLGDNMIVTLGRPTRLRFFALLTDVDTLEIQASFIAFWPLLQKPSVTTSHQRIQRMLRFRRCRRNLLLRNSSNVLGHLNLFWLSP